MIVLDIETSGMYADEIGVWQIGAIDLETGEQFFEEARIDEEDIVQEGALNISGKTEGELRDEKKQSQKQMLEKFFNWCGKIKAENFLSQCPQVVDFPCLFLKARKYSLEFPLHYRTFDLHSIAQTKYFEINGKFLIENGRSDMGLSNCLKFCGMKDERVKVSTNDGGIVKKGKPHNALEDAKLTAECFSRLMHGKNLFPEYAEFPVPEYLRSEK